MRGEIPSIYDELIPSHSRITPFCVTPVCASISNFDRARQLSAALNRRNLVNDLDEYFFYADPNLLDSLEIAVNIRPALRRGVTDRSEVVEGPNI
jgi:hypothetical protein